jgi:hypothetical protein
MMKRFGVAMGVLALSALVLGACSGSTPESEGPSTSTTGTGTETETTSTVTETTSGSAATTTDTTEQESVATLSEVLGFIEVSVRIGVGEDAAVVALAVDSATLSQIAFAEPPFTPAWCSGASDVQAESDSIENFQIVMRDPAVDIAAGGAQRFELTSIEAKLGDESVAASILLVADDVRYIVAEGELFLGDSFTSGTFRGFAADGTLIEGAFLCG